MWDRVGRGGVNSNDLQGIFSVEGGRYSLEAWHFDNYIHEPS